MALALRVTRRALHFVRGKNYYLVVFGAGFRATYEACGMAA